MSLSRIAVTAWAVAVAVLIPAWLLILRYALGFGSPSLALASSLILVAFLALVAWYWHGETTP